MKDDLDYKLNVTQILLKSLITRLFTFKKMNKLLIRIIRMKEKLSNKFKLYHNTSPNIINHKKLLQKNSNLKMMQRNNFWTPKFRRMLVHWAYQWQLQPSPPHSYSRTPWIRGMAHWQCWLDRLPSLLDIN